MLTKTERDARIIALHGEGKNYGQIAREMCVSKTTVIGAIARAESATPDRGEKCINNLTVRLPDSLIALVRRAAANAGHSIGEEMRAIIVAHFESQTRSNDHQSDTRVQSI